MASNRVRPPRKRSDTERGQARPLRSETPTGHKELKMKRSCFCVAAVSAITITAAFQSAADASQDVGRLVNAPLWQIARVIEPPCVGEIWENNAPLLTVLQVVDGGVLATTRQSALDSEPRTKIIFVRTNRTYADGDVLANGYYRATGTMSYHAVSGAQKTVYAFEELSASEQRGITAIRQDKVATAAAQRRAAEERQQRAEQTVEFKKSKERIAAEEAAEKERLAREKQERENAAEIAKLNAEKDNRVAALKAAAEEEANRQKAEHAREMARLAREREEQDKENRKRIAAAKAEKRQADAKLAIEIQKERGRYAADALTAFDFNFKHHCVIQRSIRKNVRVELIDPEWEKLANFHAKQDWLGLLGAIDGEECDEFPSEKEIDTILDSLKKKSFRASIKGLRPPSCVDVHARRMSGNSSVYGGGNGWGRMTVFCKDAQMNRIKTIDEVKGEEVKVAPFDGKILVIDSDHRRLNQELGLKSGQGLGSTLDEKAEEVEEWLKLN